MKTMKATYNESAVRASHQWLGIRGVTELAAFHPAYAPRVGARANPETFPRIAYASTLDEVVAFVARNAGERLVCMGLNPRPSALYNAKGYLRAAREGDMALSQNALIDVDIEAKEITPAHAQAVKVALDRVNEYFEDHQLQKPTRSFSGRGYHLLLAYPGVSLKAHPDVPERLRALTRQVRGEVRQDLASLEARIDDTADVIRKIKVPGTYKPSVGVLSTFPKVIRNEDHALRDYLLSLSLSADAADWNSRVGAKTPYAISLALDAQLPAWFTQLVHRDERIRALWGRDWNARRR